MTSTESISAALVDVRKSFRLLHGYNRRIRDIVELCSKLCPETPASYQTFSVTPLSSRKSPLGTWLTWDCLPTVQWTFLFQPDKENNSKSKKIRHMIAIDFVADSEYEDSDDRDPDPVKFGSAELASSAADLVMIAASPGALTDWPRIWDEYSLDENQNVAEGLLDCENKYTAYWRSVPMEEFVDEASVRTIFNSFRTEAMAALGLS